MVRGTAGSTDVTCVHFSALNCLACGKAALNTAGGLLRSAILLLAQDLISVATDHVDTGYTDPSGHAYTSIRHSKTGSSLDETRIRYDSSLEEALLDREGRECFPEKGDGR